MAQTVGHWGIWGIYEEPEENIFSPETWERYLEELHEVGPFAEGAIPTKEDMIKLAEERIAKLKAVNAEGMTLTLEEMENRVLAAIRAALRKK